MFNKLMPIFKSDIAAKMRKSKNPTSVIAGSYMLRKYDTGAMMSINTTDWHTLIFFS